MVYRVAAKPEPEKRPTWWSALTQKPRFVWVMTTHFVGLVNLVIAVATGNGWWPCMAAMAPLQILSVVLEIKRSIDDWRR